MKIHHKGKQEGWQAGRVETIKELVAAGVDWSVITRATGLSAEQFQRPAHV